ncbi:hypothetical protein [uncultured Roseobacter sp.]|uniref:hypothetical protein n=1 Tax=uncultured Roseobacter sp. TaxID=114847 RepID=UPI002620285F|nr:hypothetical protein [uncultured Roseobacter sp.]
MTHSPGDFDTLLSQLATRASERQYPDNYRMCMMAAAAFVDEAANCVTQHSPGHRVAELLLLAARLEDLSLAQDTSSSEQTN